MRDKNIWLILQERYTVTGRGREESEDLMKIVDKQMKFSLCFCGTMKNLFSECTSENRATGQTNEKQLDRTSSILWLRQKIVYFKYDAKDEQNCSPFAVECNCQFEETENHFGSSSGAVKSLSENCR